MKQFVNNFALSGFVCADAQVRTFENNSVARFSLIIRHSEKSGEKTTSPSALQSIEMWRRNDNLADFDLLKKGSPITLEGYFKPTEWNDAETGEKRNRVVLTATKVFTTPDKDENADA